MSKFNATGIQPRGNFVLVQFVLEPDKMVGLIKVPTGENEYVEAEVLAVGPGTVSAEGGREDTFDLKPGAKVLLQHKKTTRGPGGQMGKQSFTIPVTSRFTPDKNLHLIPEHCIVLIHNSEQQASLKLNEGD